MQLSEWGGGGSERLEVSVVFVFLSAYSGYCSTKGNQATSPPTIHPLFKKHVPPLEPRLSPSEEINVRAGGSLGDAEWKEGCRFVLCL